MHGTLTEKLVVLLLAKLTNLVPEGGIWMNTQRPEWNDANNALVGKGLSVVTVAYLRRFVAFWQAQLAAGDVERMTVNSAVASLLGEVHGILATNRRHLQTGFSDQARRAIMDQLGMAATAYRAGVYQDGFPSTQVELERQTLSEFLELAQTYIEHTLRANRRPDGLAHSYNILRLHEEGVAVEHLYLMLEGQVALLSSGMLSSEESLALLQTLRQSDLYRADQHSYMLYPNRHLPGFLQKNNVPAAEVAGSRLVTALTAVNDQRLLIRDDAGVYHFNGDFHNAGDVARVLDELAQEPVYAPEVLAERAFVLDLFETTFDHRRVYWPFRHLLRLRGAGQHLLAHGVEAAAGCAGMLPACSRGRSRRICHGGAGGCLLRYPARSGFQQDPRRVRRVSN